jgi:hypothetical protein
MNRKVASEGGGGEMNLVLTAQTNKLRFGFVTETAMCSVL